MGLAGGEGVVGGAAAALGRRGEAALAAAAAPAAPSPSPPPPPPTSSPEAGSSAAAALAAATTSPGAAALRAAQRDLLPRVLAFLARAVPGLAEARALAAAVAALDAPFLVVVAGEFNSGKSTLINALLGGRYLEDGILPTTNEIAVLKFQLEEGEKGKEKDGLSPTSSSADEDTEGGAAVRRLPAPLLRHATIVDTPGTNAILERQQRLTEEFIPRADLVLFALSADRPFTESEAGFLRYIRRWGKKVLFALNKADALPHPDDADRVAAFVAGAAADVLGLADPVVLPISARLALQAKEAAAGGGGVRPSRWAAGDPRPPAPDPAALASSPAWAASRFAALEATVARFLVEGVPGGADPSSSPSSQGDGDAGPASSREALAVGAGEGLRLKLETPLFLAAALLSAAGEALQAEAEAADADVASLAAVSSQLASFASEMERDAASQRAAARKAITRGAARAAAAVDETLTLSNWEGWGPYLFGSRRGGSGLSSLPASSRLAEDAALAAAGADLAAAATEHRAWLDANVGAQRASYRAFVEERARALGVAVEEMDAAAAKATAAPAAVVGGPSTTALATTSDARGAASAAVARFDAPAAGLLLEEELREAALATAAGTAAAALLGAGLTSILPGFAEDALALALAAAVGYLALLNLPLRRAEAKGKVAKAADAYAADVEAGFKAELSADLRALEAEVGAWVAPLAAAAEGNAAAAAAAAAEAEALAGEVAGLRTQAAAL